jgi:NAD(P)-dependent dehydrogenase (short-subunit alcohol dehydrogenase family)
MKLEDKIVLITGAAHGIGRALAERFHAEGARAIAVADVDLAGARAVAESIGGLALEVDVSCEDDLIRAVERTEADLGPIDLFCSNAGVAFSDAPGWTATSQTNEQWERIWKINVMAHVWGARAMVPRMIARGGGYLLQTVSAAGLLNQVGDAAYSVSKHASLAFAEALAITHGDQGIKVSALCPEAVLTRMFQGEEHAAPAAAASMDGVLSPEQVAACVVEGLAAEKFLILPHPPVRTYFERKAADYDRWLAGMRRLRAKFFPDENSPETSA